MPHLLSFRSLLISSLLFTLSQAVAVEPDSPPLFSNVGPLTTQFEPPSTCLAEVRTRIRFGYPNLELGCEGPEGNECCPSQWERFGYYSPGVCPTGYQTCTLPSTRQQQETTNLCCPGHFICPTDEGSDCSSSQRTPIPTIATIDGTAITSTLDVVYATNIQIRYQASDSSVVPVPTETNLPPVDDGSLTPGEKGGIAVGVIVGVVALGGAGCFLKRRYKKDANAQ